MNGYLNVEDLSLTWHTLPLCLIISQIKANINSIYQQNHQVNMATTLQRFLRKNPIFTYDIFAQAISGDHARSKNTIKALLAHHIQQGHIIRVRRRLFAAVPVGADPKTYPINPYLVAGYATSDAVLAYHSALSFYQMAYSASYRFTYLTQYQSSHFSFRSESYEGVRFPASLVQQHQESIFIHTEDVQGLNVRVTSLERTLVDVLDKPKLGGGWEEIWRSLDMIDRIKINQVAEYALLLNNATTVAKVGFYLSQRQKELNVPADVLLELQKACPRSPHYIDHTARKNGKLLDDWNIIVPKTLIIKSSATRGYRQ
ncbi:MAG: transcriptional regulator [Gammaproteobacteria bacterium]|nr:transcriptional regulator [Gammaproteobacteria bacterium]